MAPCFESWQKSPYWNIVLLALAWALTLSTSTLLTTVGPLSAKDLGQPNAMASFTIGIFLVGAAFSSVPSGWLFRTYGRFWGFTLGCLFQFIGSALGVLALLTREAVWLYMGCFSIGLAQGLGQFYRFSAVEITPPHLKSRAVTYVLSGGIIAAFLGPTSATYSVHIFDKDYMGSYAMVAVFAILNQFVLHFVNFPPRASAVATVGAKQEYSRILSAGGDDEAGVNAEVIQGVNPIHDKEDQQHQQQHHDDNDDDDEDDEQPERSPSFVRRTTWQIVTQPMFVLSCAIATLAHTIMVMLMSNVTLDMEDHGYGFSMTSLVMELHFFAMFSPGFISGRMIEKYGSLFVSFLGGFLFAGSSVVLAIDTASWNYVLGMILLGVAWNFSFSAGTVMLTSSYDPREATEVQAVNDFLLFSVAGGGSLGSGFIYSAAGWLVLIYVCSGMMLAYLMLFVTAWGGKETDDGLEEALVPDSKSTESDATIRVTKVENSILRGLSFSSRLDGRAESTDVFTPVRTISVA
eukprot:gene2280-2495_t